MMIGEVTSLALAIVVGLSIYLLTTKSDLASICGLVSLFLFTGITTIMAVRSDRVDHREMECNLLRLGNLGREENYNVM